MNFLTIARSDFKFKDTSQIFQRSKRQQYPGATDSLVRLLERYMKPASQSRLLYT